MTGLLLPDASPAPLLGHNLVRLVYLDEGGTDFKAPVLAVAGVLVHGDHEYPEVDRRILALIDKFIPEPDRLGFVFHATDIFHGARYFDRRKPQWDRVEKRMPIIDGLAAIIEDLHLPIVCGTYRKEKYDAKHPIWETPPDDKIRSKFLHSSAVMDALMRADKWLAKYSPTELATVIHEDGTPAKRMIKGVVRTMRSRALMYAQGFDERMCERNNLPLKRIIDTVHFAEKADARPLQLADLCAFILARGLKGETQVPKVAFDIMWRHMRWFFQDSLPPDKANLDHSQIYDAERSS